MLLTVIGLLDAVSTLFFQERVGCVQTNFILKDKKLVVN